MCNSQTRAVRYSLLAAESRQALMMLEHMPKFSSRRACILHTKLIWLGACSVLHAAVHHTDDTFQMLVAHRGKASGYEDKAMRHT